MAKQIATLNSDNVVEGVLTAEDISFTASLIDSGDYTGYTFKDVTDVKVQGREVSEGFKYLTDTNSWSLNIDVVDISAGESVEDTIANYSSSIAADNDILEADKVTMISDFTATLS